MPFNEVQNLDKNGDQIGEFGDEFATKLPTQSSVVLSKGFCLLALDILPISVDTEIYIRA